MPTLKRISLKQILILITVCTASAVLGFASRRGAITTSTVGPALRQSDEKVLDIKRFPDEPYRVREIKVKNTKVEPAQAFSARSLASAGGGQGADWLENLELTIKNQSDTMITYILLEIDFPETAAGQPMMVYSKPFGIPPNAPAAQVQRRKAFSLGPGDTAILSLSPSDLQGIKEFLATRNYQLPNLTKAVVRMGVVTFADGIRWEQGHRYRPNPGVRGGYEEIKGEN